MTAQTPNPSAGTALPWQIHAGSIVCSSDPSDPAAAPAAFANLASESKTARPPPPVPQSNKPQATAAAPPKTPARSPHRTPARNRVPAHLQHTTLANSLSIRRRPARWCRIGPAVAVTKAERDRESPMRSYVKRERPSRWSERTRNIAQPWAAPFWALEWASEWLAYFLSNWTFLEVLDHL